MTKYFMNKTKELKIMLNVLCKYKTRIKNIGGINMQTRFCLT